MVAANKQIDILPALKNFDSLPDSAFVRLPVVKALFGGRSSASIYRDVLAGRLPPPTSLGPRCSGWSVGALRNAQSKLSGTDPGSTNGKGQAVAAAEVSVAKRRARLDELAGQA